MKTRHTGDKFLALIIMNSLMRTKNKDYITVVDKKILQRLYVIAAGSKGPNGILSYSDKKFQDKEAAAKFNLLL